MSAWMRSRQNAPDRFFLFNSASLPICFPGPITTSSSRSSAASLEFNRRLGWNLPGSRSFCSDPGMVGFFLNASNLQEGVVLDFWLLLNKRALKNPIWSQN